jgi:hypothetical protein
VSDDASKLNGPDRYRKRSPRLVLEEHSHCEVPAGCGGVVLRWIHADREVTVRVRLYSYLAGATLTIDGATPASSRPLLARGDHVLAIHARAARGVGAILASVRFNEKSYDRSVSRATGLAFACDSTADGTWRATTTPPADARWRSDPFDDRAWTPMIEMAVPPPPEREGRSWAHRDLTNDGVRGLGLADVEGELWIRARFRIPLVGEPGGGT